MRLGAFSLLAIISTTAYAYPIALNTRNDGYGISSRPPSENPTGHLPLHTQSDLSTSLFAHGDDASNKPVAPTSNGDSGSRMRRRRRSIGQSDDADCLYYPQPPSSSSSETKRDGVGSDIERSSSISQSLHDISGGWKYGTGLVSLRSTAESAPHRPDHLPLDPSNAGTPAPEFHSPPRRDYGSASGYTSQSAGASSGSALSILKGALHGRAPSSEPGHHGHSGRPNPPMVDPPVKATKRSGSERDVTFEPERHAEHAQRRSSGPSGTTPGAYAQPYGFGTSVPGLAGTGYFGPDIPPPEGFPHRPHRRSPGSADFESHNLDSSANANAMAAASQKRSTNAMLGMDSSPAASEMGQTNQMVGTMETQGVQGAAAMLAHLNLRGYEDAPVPASGALVNSK